MKDRGEQAIPHARKQGLLVEHLSDEVLVYDLECHKAHCLNRTAALVWAHCDGKTTVTEMVRLVGNEMQAPVVEDVVWYAMDQLTKARLLNGPMTRSWDAGKLSRREVIRRMGWVTALALPLVTSIMAPTPAQAGSINASGAPCTDSAQCASGVCSGGACL